MSLFKTNTRIVELLANRIDLLRKKEVVELVGLSISFFYLAFSLILGTTSPHPLNLGLQLLESILVLISKLFSDFHGAVHMRREVVLARKLENICVEGGHLRLNVVEEEGLLHVAALEFDRNFFEELRDGQLLS